MLPRVAAFSSRLRARVCRCGLAAALAAAAVGCSSPEDHTWVRGANEADSPGVPAAGAQPSAAERGGVRDADTPAGREAPGSIDVDDEGSAAADGAGEASSESSHAPEVAPAPDELRPDAEPPLEPEEPSEPPVPPPACSLGLTVDGRFQELSDDPVLRMAGGLQANLLLLLGIQVRELIDLSTTTIEVRVSSEYGSSRNFYLRGGPTPHCDPEADPPRCELLSLVLSTLELAEDPFGLADLPVVAEASVSVGGQEFCAVEVAGRLRRFE